MKTVISIPDKTFISAERLAKRMKIPRSRLYTKAVEEFVLEHRFFNVKEKLDEVYGKEKSTLNPVILKIQELFLLKDSW